MYYSKRFKELSFKFAIFFGLDIFAVHLNFIAKSMVLGLHSLVMGSFMKLWSMMEVFSIYSYPFSEHCY